MTTAKAKKAAEDAAWLETQNPTEPAKPKHNGESRRIRAEQNLALMQRETQNFKPIPAATAEELDFKTIHFATMNRSEDLHPGRPTPPTAQQQAMALSRMNQRLQLKEAREKIRDFHNRRHLTEAFEAAYKRSLTNLLAAIERYREMNGDPEAEGLGLPDFIT